MSETKVYSVKGMSCGHCKSAVERAVSELAGVKSAEANLEKHELTVLYADNAIEDEFIKRAVEEEGYQFEGQ